MQWTLPGTTLTAPMEEAEQTDALFRSLFLAGGLTLSQVASITGLEPYTIQNWVRRGFLAPPVRKRYTMEQVCRLININLLRGILPLEQILNLMRYLNGDLADESDDLVDDTMLYFQFVILAAHARSLREDNLDEALDAVTESYRESVEGAREKLKQVLKVMLLTWQANCLRARADSLLSALEILHEQGEMQHG